MIRTISQSVARPIFPTIGRQINTLSKRVEDLRICFVPNPMTSVAVAGRDEFWRQFDRRYYAVHPNLKPADASIWELPHWIPWLAGVLKAEGWKQVSALSLLPPVPLYSKVDEELVAKEVAAHPADVYLYSPMTVNLHLALEMASIVKKVNRSSLNVFGGIISTPLHKEIAAHPDVDFVVRDRGEFALPEFLRAVTGNGQLKNVKNLTFKENSEIHSHSELHPYIEPKDLPFPDHQIFSKSVGEKIRYIRQNYGIGCPFKCSFCTIQTIGRKPGYFPVERVISEIKAYRSHYGEHHNIYFGDETFTVNREKTLEICHALKNEGNITYDIQTRLMSLNNDEVLSALRESGCKWVEVGLETVSQKSMDVHKQRTNLSKMVDILKRLKDHNLPVCSFIVNGLPEQTIDEMRRSLDAVCGLIDEGLLHATYLNGLVPYPGSGMHAHPEKYGLKIKHQDYKLYLEEALPVYDTVHATAEQIHEVFLEGVLKFSQSMSRKPVLGVELPPTFFDQRGKILVHV